jgi:hypothetical protein
VKQSRSAIISAISLAVILLLLLLFAAFAAWSISVYLLLSEVTLVVKLFAVCSTEEALVNAPFAVVSTSFTSCEILFDVTSILLESSLFIVSVYSLEF